MRESRPVSYRAIVPGVWHVPAAADLACLGWWAGSGEVLYVTSTESAATVFIRRVGEQEQETVFRILKEIPLN